MPQKLLFKDIFREKTVKKLWTKILTIYPEFDLEGFILESCKNFENEELKQRNMSIVKAFRKYLSQDLEVAAEILYNTMDKSLCVDNFSWTKWLDSFILMPIWYFYSEYLISDFDKSMDAFYKFTKLFTAEDVIRPFIKNYPKETLKLLAKWAVDDDENVRRLVSEWIRPLLPWAERLDDFVEDPMPVLMLLERLVYDDSLYVRRSVANNLNDISKNQPELVIKFLGDNKVNTPEYEWLTKHALRTLIKKGNKEALEMVWVKHFEGVVKKLKIKENKIKVGDDLEFDFEILANLDSHILVDYAILFVMKNWKHSKKVFKLKKLDVKKVKIVKLNKKHSFKPITTRKYYEWEHIIEIQVNWEVLAKKEFYLSL